MEQIEALLFSSGRAMNLEELSRLMRTRKTDFVRECARKLMEEYNGKNSSLMMVEETDAWKLTTREKFLSVVRKVVAQTELSKTILETLAVIAYKSPVNQSDVIRVRTNKAYDHIKELERLGYISAQKHGRTKLIRLSQKFFDYFDVDQDKLKKKFDKFGDVEAMIKEKEKEIEEKNRKLGISIEELEAEEVQDRLKHESSQEKAVEVSSLPEKSLVPAAESFSEVMHDLPGVEDVKELVNDEDADEEEELEAVEELEEKPAPEK